jgi:hypothetical protein
MAGIPEEEFFAFLIFQSVTPLGAGTKYRTSNVSAQNADLETREDHHPT